jgi:hypothetical protein
MIGMVKVTADNIYGDGLDRRRDETLYCTREKEGI